MPSNDVILTDQYCHDPIWNGLQEAVNGLDPANLLAIFRAVIAAVIFEFIKAEALLEHVSLSLFIINLSTWVSKHPKQFALIVSGIILVTFASLSPTILAAVGFGSKGPIAHSIAAGIQSSIGSVSARSAFAILQGAAMGGQAKAIFPLSEIFGTAMTIWGLVPAVEQVIRGIADKIPEFQSGEKAVVFQLEANFAQLGLEIAKVRPAEKIAKLYLEKKFAELSQWIAELHLGRMFAELQLEEKFAELGNLGDEFGKLRLGQRFAWIGAQFAGLHLDAIVADVGRHARGGWERLMKVLSVKQE